jgi:hypothetical protein
MRIVTKNPRVQDEFRRLINRGGDYNVTARVLSTKGDETEYELTYKSVIDVAKVLPSLSDRTATIYLG